MATASKLLWDYVCNPSKSPFEKGNLTWRIRRASAPNTLITYF